MATISAQLGYPDDSREPVILPSRAASVSAILTGLDQADVAIANAVADSMAEKVGELTVNYTKHINLLKLQGSRLLRQLSTMTGLPILYDRFRETEVWVPATYNRLAMAAIGDQTYYDRFRAGALRLDTLSASEVSTGPSVRSYI